MKAKIIEVSEQSAHYDREYSIVGTVGDVYTMDLRNGETFVILENCQFAEENEEAGLVNGIRIVAFCKKVEIVEE